MSGFFGFPLDGGRLPRPFSRVHVALIFVFDHAGANCARPKTDVALDILPLKTLQSCVHMQEWLATGKGDATAIGCAIKTYDIPFATLQPQILVKHVTCGAERAAHLLSPPP